MPASSISINGQGLGLRSQNSLKSSAASAGTIIRFVCTMPCAWPEVWALKLPARARALTSLALNDWLPVTRYREIMSLHAEVGFLHGRAAEQIAAQAFDHHAPGL